VDRISIKSLRVTTRIGVPDDERASPQEVEIDIILEPTRPFSEMHDDIARTVDYAAVAERISSLAAHKPRRLIESLASEIATALVTEFDARSATVEIRKFILPSTNHVSVGCTRTRNSP